MKMRSLGQLIISFCAILPHAAWAATSEECQMRTLTLGGTLPIAAKGIYEMSLEDASQLTSTDRPTAMLALDEYGYPGSVVPLRFSRTESYSWSVEELENPVEAGKAAETRNWSPPLMFTNDGEKISKVTIEIKPAKVPEGKAGDRLFLAFDDLNLGSRFTSLDVISDSSRPAPCAEPPRLALTPEQAADPRNQMKIYTSAEEGLKAMLNDRPEPEMR